MKFVLSSFCSSTGSSEQSLEMSVLVLLKEIVGEVERRGRIHCQISSSVSLEADLKRDEWKRERLRCRNTF